MILCESKHMAARSTHSPGHVFAPTTWIGTMSLAWVVGMDTLGYWESLNAYATAWTSRLGEGMRDLPAWMILLATIFLAYLLPFLMLSTPHGWQRLILWISMTLLTAAWLPVLALAGWKFSPAMPIITLAWSGICAFIYAQRHPLPCEMPAVSSSVIEPSSAAEI